MTSIRTATFLGTFTVSLPGIALGLSLNQGTHWREVPLTSSLYNWGTWGPKSAVGLVVANGGDGVQALVCPTWEHIFTTDKQDRRSPGNLIKWGKVEGIGGLGIITFFNYLRHFVGKGLIWLYKVCLVSEHTGYRETDFDSVKGQVINSSASQWSRLLHKAGNPQLKTFGGWITIGQAYSKRDFFSRDRTKCPWSSFSDIPWFYESWGQAKKEEVTFLNNTKGGKPLK